MGLTTATWSNITLLGSLIFCVDCQSMSQFFSVWFLGCLPMNQTHSPFLRIASLWEALMVKLRAWGNSSWRGYTRGWRVWLPLSTCSLILMNEHPPLSWATRTRDHGDVAVGVTSLLGWKGRNPVLKQTVRGLTEWVTSSIADNQTLQVKNKNKDKGVGYTRRWAFEGIVRCQGCKAKAGAIGTRF